MQPSGCDGHLHVVEQVAGLLQQARQGLLGVTPAVAGGRLGVCPDGREEGRAVDRGPGHLMAPAAGDVYSQASAWKRFTTAVTRVKSPGSSPG